MATQTTPLTMSQDDRHQLETWVRAGTTPQRVAFRAQICLLAAEGRPTGVIAQRMGTSRPTVLLWRKRFEEQGPSGLLKDAPRGPSPRRLDDATTKAILDTTRNVAPPDAAHWTTRALAKVLGVSNATVARVWKTHGIRPRKKKSPKPDDDRHAVRKCSQLIGAYLGHPLRALVVAVESMPSATSVNTLPANPESEHGKWRDRLHREQYGCVSCSFAALGLLDVWSGGSGGMLAGPGEFVRFLRRIAADSPNGRELHVLVDPGGTQYLPVFRPNYSKIGRFHVHSYPLDLHGKDSVATAVARLTGAPLDTGPSGGMTDLAAAIEAFVRGDNGSPRPFVWTQREQPSPAGSNLCKVISETIKHVGACLSNRMELEYGPPKVVRSEEVFAMKWKEKLESWFAAAAFAEAGEHATALEMAQTPVPAGESVEIFPSLSTVFAAAAFAEEDCHEMALQMLSGTRTRASFLEQIGLAGARIWTGIASLEPSFAEAVGLGGARYRVVTLRL